MEENEHVDLDLGMAVSRQHILAMIRTIDRHFPPDNSDVQQAKNSLMQALGYLKYVQMDFAERSTNGQPQTD